MAAVAAAMVVVAAALARVAAAESAAGGGHVIIYHCELLRQDAVLSGTGVSGAPHRDLSVPIALFRKGACRWNSIDSRRFGIPSGSSYSTSIKAAFAATRVGQPEFQSW